MVRISRGYIGRGLIVPLNAPIVNMGARRINREHSERSRKVVRSSPAESEDHREAESSTKRSPRAKVMGQGLRIPNVKKGRSLIADQIQRHFGDRVRESRRQNGISQEALAFVCDLDRAYIGSVERGERNISLVNIYKIALGLGIPARDLMP